MDIPVSNKKTEVFSHFQAIFKHANRAILVTDSQGKIITINPYALKEFGFSLKELVGKKVEILIPTRFHKTHRHYHKKYIKNLPDRLMGSGKEFFARKKKGTEIPVEICLSNYSKNGNNYVIVFVTNISDRKNAETEIEKLHDKLEKTVKLRTKVLNKTLKQLEISNTRLEKALSFQKAILDSAGAMIIATDNKGLIKIFNKEASVNIGYTPEQVIGKHTPILFHDKKEIELKRKEINKKFGISLTDEFSVMVENARRNIHAEEEFLYIRKNGSSFPVLLTITPIKDSKSRITGFMGISIDISERKKAEQDLLIALEKEKDLSELKSRFVSMASHEFRSPLSTVLSSAYLVEKYTTTEDQPKRERHLQRIVSSVQMLTDILNDFLSVGKIEEGRLMIRPSQFNLKDLIIKIAGDMKVGLKKQQKIKYQHEGNTDVFLDPSLLRHIVMNLFSNASKFSAEASPIEIKTINQDDKVVLSVKDYGIGISKEDQKHLTERFFRGSNASNIQGTGLGLHIVAKYAELMNGGVECKSELEKGTEIIVSFNTKTESNENDFTD